MCAEHWLWSRLPTFVEPVNERWRTRPSARIGSVSLPEVDVVTTLSAPAGNPASSNSRARNSMVSGVFSAGFTMTAQPVAMAGAILRAPMARGKFHGVISSETPTGSRLSTIWPRPLGDCPCEPCTRRPSCAYHCR